MCLQWNLDRTELTFGRGSNFKYLYYTEPAYNGNNSVPCRCVGGSFRCVLILQRYKR